MRLFSHELHTDIQLVIMATFLTIWAWPDIKRCGWRYASSCDLCGSTYEFECSGQCSLISDGLSVQPIDNTSNVCCQSVLVSSDVQPWNKRPVPDALGGFMVVDGASNGGRPVYSHYSLYLFFQNDSVDVPGWRVSDEFPAKTEYIRQSDGVDTACPSKVTQWEFNNSPQNGDSDWRVDHSLIAECANYALSNSTCADAAGTSGVPTAAFVWVSAVIAAFAIHTLLLVLRWWRRHRLASATAKDEASAMVRRTPPEKNASLVTALACASTAAGLFGFKVGLSSRCVDRCHEHKLAMCGVCLLVLVIYSFWLFTKHDIVVAIAEEQSRERAAKAYALALVLFPIFLALVLPLSIATYYDSADLTAALAFASFMFVMALVLAYHFWANRLRLRPLAALDDKLAEALASDASGAPAIRLLDADVLRSGAISRIETRQILERRQSAGECLFVQPQEAVRLLKVGRRKIGFLTYGWRTSDHPDPDNKTLEAVVKALRSEHGKHIAAVFWDCPCLWQGPRTPGQTMQFKQGLKVMADGYASPLGVTVLRRKHIPPVPEELVGRVVIFGVASAASEEGIRRALVGWGRTLNELWFELDPAPPGDATPRESGRWHAHFATHSEAVEAVDELEAMPEGQNGVALWYNDREYTNRGWCTFESFVSTEALYRIEAHSRLRSALQAARLPAKLLEIDGETPVPIELETTSELIDERISSMRLAIASAAFTGKADKPTVLHMLDTYIDKIATAMYRAGEGGKGQYEGERNSGGEPEGHGIYRFADGTVYEGDFVDGERHGHGIMRLAKGGVIEGSFSHDSVHGHGILTLLDGTIYEGEWAFGIKLGRFAVTLPDGTCELCCYAADNKHGVAVRWSAGQKSARQIVHAPSWLVLCSLRMEDQIQRWANTEFKLKLEAKLAKDGIAIILIALAIFITVVPLLLLAVSIKVRNMLANLFERKISMEGGQHMHPDALALIGYLGKLLYDKGDLDGAEPLLRKELEGTREALGDRHERTLGLIHLLGSLLEEKGDLDDAEALLREALEGCRETLGDRHESTLISIYYLGSLLEEKGDLDGAEALLREALEGRRETLGDRHPSTLKSINTLGMLLEKKGDLDGAEALLREVVEGTRETLGDRHRSTLISINNLGLLLKAKGDLDGAEALLREALEGERETLGDRHPSTLSSISNLGTLLEAKGDLDGAEALYREALEGERETLGDRHPDTLTSIYNLGLLLQAKGRLGDAITLFREELEGCRETLGDRHPDTLTSINNLGTLLRAKGDLDGAEALLRDALEGCRETLGDRHTDTLDWIGNYADLLREKGDLDAARRAMGDAPEVAREALKADHMTTLVLEAKAARIDIALGAADANALCEVVARMELALGAEHTQTRKYRAISV